MIARLLGVLAMLAASAHADRPTATPAALGLAKPAKAAKADATADTELAALTDDPVLGKADRISGEEVKGLVTFTFDDGPHPEITPRVLETLARYDIPATFFIVTKKLATEDGRAALQQIIDGGYAIASHTVSHPNLRRATKQRLASEIDGSIRRLAEVAGRPIGLFRAPFGALDKRGRALLAKRGLTEAFWSVDTRDWEIKDAKRLRESVVAAILAQEGGVVLFHDVKALTAEVLPLVLDDLEAENCARLAAKRTPIVPVSIHYWLRDKKVPRAVPEDVEARTAAYRDALPVRCATRANPIAIPDVLRPLLWAELPIP